MVFYSATRTLPKPSVAKADFKMNRLGLIHPDTMTGRPNSEVRALYRLLAESTSSTFGTACTTKLPVTGALIGSPGILLHSPELGRGFLRFAAALEGLPGLTDRSKVVVILTVVIHEDARYETYAHQRLALARGLLTVDEMEDLLASRCPETFGDVDEVAFTTARELCLAHGPLSLQAWTAAIDRLGRDGALKLVQLVGFYRYIAAISNGLDAQVPVESERIEGAAPGMSAGPIRANVERRP